MDTEALEELGLTESEIKTYIALIELGSSGAGRMLEKTGLQNSVLHRALNSLIEKGLINFILEGRRRIYQATDPGTLVEFIEEKRRKVEMLIPELIRKKQLAKQTENASIYKGIRGIKEVYRILRDTKAEEYLSFGGGEECEMMMGTTWWKNHHIKRIENRLPSRQIFDETVRRFGSDLIKQPISQVRYLPAQFSQFQETVIVGDKVAITIFTKSPYSILIIDGSVAKGYRKHFGMMWDNAKGAASQSGR